MLAPLGACRLRRTTRDVPFFVNIQEPPHWSLAVVGAVAEHAHAAEHEHVSEHVSLKTNVSPIHNSDPTLILNCAFDRPCFYTWGPQIIFGEIVVRLFVPSSFSFFVIYVIILKWLMNTC